MKFLLDPLCDAITNFDEALEFYHSQLAADNPKAQSHFRASTIQAYEYTYELTVKFIRRYIKSISINPDEVDKMSFKSLIREAYGLGLIESELVDWLDYRKNRAATSHAYSESVAQRVFEQAPIFLAEAKYVLAELQKKVKDFDEFG